MANQPTSSDLSSRTAVASYVASMTADLATMTRRTGLETLSYLLEMVRLEAESTRSQSSNVNEPSRSGANEMPPSEPR